MPLEEGSNGAIRLRNLEDRYNGHETRVAILEVGLKDIREGVQENRKVLLSQQKETILEFANISREISKKIMELKEDVVKIGNNHSCLKENELSSIKEIVLDHSDIINSFKGGKSAILWIITVIIMITGLIITTYYNNKSLKETRNFVIKKTLENNGD